MESLATQTYSVDDKNVQPSENIVQSTPQNSALVPSSVYLRSLLLPLKSKPQDALQSILQVTLGGQLLHFECSEPLDIPSELQCKGYLQKSMMSVKLKPKLTVTVTSDGHSSQSVLQYLYTSNRVAVLQTSDAADMLLLSADSLSAGSLQHLHASDANFLALMFRLRKLEVEPVTMPEGGLAEYIPTDLSFEPGISDEKEFPDKRGFWDANALEAWRRKDNIGFR